MLKPRSPPPGRFQAIAIPKGLRPPLSRSLRFRTTATFALPKPGSRTNPLETARKTYSARAGNLIKTGC